MKSIADFRNEYTLAGLDERDLDAEPVGQFDRWLTDALAAQVFEPTAMTLATVDAHGRPAARVVLLKHFDAEGFCFFTNYLSAKGEDLVRHPYAALVMYWPQLERQVRVSGPVTMTSVAESDEYFKRRPRGSQLGAWVSEQSRVIETRSTLEGGLLSITKKFEGIDVARPPHWGGFRVRHDAIEFWQGRQNRLHDRLVYTRQGKDGWKIERLAP